MACTRDGISGIREPRTRVLAGSLGASLLPDRRCAVRPLKIIVIDPRRRATAAEADLHIKPCPGANVAVLNIFTTIVLYRSGLLGRRPLEDAPRAISVQRRQAAQNVLRVA